MKLWKWHTLTFKCPRCGGATDYALQVRNGPHKGSSWDPAYWCASCSTPAHVREPWLFGAVYGPVMAFVAAFAYDAISRSLSFSSLASIASASVCCAVIGWPLSRFLSRHLVCWEIREPRSRRTPTERF